jgi:hypothetical protein
MRRRIMGWFGDAQGKAAQGRFLLVAFSDDFEKGPISTLRFSLRHCGILAYASLLELCKP